MEIRLQPLIGAPYVAQGGRIVDLGLFAEDNTQIFAASPRALQEIHRYRAFKVSGTVLWAIGFAAILTDLAFINSMPKQPGAYWGVLAGGVVTGVTGTILAVSANRHLQNAVDDYNEDLYRNLSGAAARGRSVSFKYAFEF